MAARFDSVARKAAPPDKARATSRTRAISPFWARQFRAWHWITSAVCLVGLLLFAGTGITLNHAGSLAAEPKTVTRSAKLPPALLRLLESKPSASNATPTPVRRWIADSFGVDTQGRTAEWSEDELYIPLPRAGGDGWIAIDRASGEATFEDTDRGWIAYLNDLHKGRDTGAAWRWFIDIFAAACVIFSLTGFLLLQIHARKRPFTWPLVGAGIAIPVALLIFFAH